jgi:formiminotetrahydrofolate cyclodeaminase
VSQNLVDLTSRAFSDSLAARTATPGGGSLAALMVADAAALLCMVARFSTGEAYAEVSSAMEARCAAGERVRQRALELVDLDARSYDAVSAAFKLPKADDEQNLVMRLLGALRISPRREHGSESRRRSWRTRNAARPGAQSSAQY